MQQKREKNKSIGHLNLKNLKSQKSTPNLRKVEKPSDAFPQLSARDTKGMPKNKSQSSPRIFGESSFLAKRHRPRANSAMTSTPREGEIPVEKIILESRLIEIINQFHEDLQKGKKCTFKPSQLDCFFQYCHQYNVQESENLKRVCEERALTPFLYQQILNHLREQQPGKQQSDEDNFNKKFVHYLKWYEQCDIDSDSAARSFDVVKLSRPKKSSNSSDTQIDTEPSHPIEPKELLDFDEHQEIKESEAVQKSTCSTDRRKRLELLWKITTKQKIEFEDSSKPLTTDEFTNLLKGLCHSTKPHQLIRDINKLIPFMNAKQIGIAQIIVFHLIHYKTDHCSSTARKNLHLFNNKIYRRRKELRKQKAYFGRQIKAFTKEEKPFNQSTLSKSTTCLEQWFKQSLKDSELVAFTRLFEQGIEAYHKNKKNRHKIANEIANELINASTFFYQSLPLSELFLEKQQRRVLNQYTVYFNYLYSSVTNHILQQQSDEDFAAAIHLLVNVSRKLSFQSDDGGFADLNSLMILATIFGNCEVEKRLEKCLKISKNDRHFILKLSKTMSPSQGYKELNKATKEFHYHIPYLGLISRQLQFAKDGNNDDLLRLAVYGQLIDPVYRTQQRLAGQTVFFNSSIIREMRSDADWSILKPLDVKILWKDDESFGHSLEKIETALNNHQKPCLIHKGRVIKPEAVDTFLWVTHETQKYPTNSENEESNNAIEERLTSLSVTLYQRTHSSKQLSHLLAEDNVSLSPEPIKRTPRLLESLSRFGSFRVYREETSVPNGEDEYLSQASNSPR